MSQTKDKLKAFFTNLDSINRERLKDLACTAFNEYCEDAPGPDRYSRPIIEDAIKKAVDDFCSE